MSLRYMFRALGWVVSELIPAQAIRCAQGRDYEAALNKVEAEVDHLEPGMTWAEFCGPYESPEIFADSAVPPPADGPGGVAAGSPPIPPPGPPTTFVEWAIPAICEILASHEAYMYGGRGNLWCLNLEGHNHAERGDWDWQDWSMHVAPILAAHLESALLTEFPRGRR